MDHQTIKPEFSQGTNDQSQIILLWAYYAKTQFSRGGFNAGKGRKNEKKRKTIRNPSDGLSYDGALLEDLKDQLKDGLPQRKSIYGVAKHQHQSDDI